MRFYNREKELQLLRTIEERSTSTSQMTFVVGRRRIGKTLLIKKAFSEQPRPFLYFFVAKKNEALLCEEYITEITQKLNVKLHGRITSFKALFSYLMELSCSQPFTLAIDEFQEFSNVNASIYSDMQNSWDQYKSESKLNLVLSGSIYSLMNKIFEHSKEPLFGRATARLHLKAFDIPTIKEILSDYSPNYTSEDLLAFYAITGGVAKYVELLIESKAFTTESIIDTLFSHNSLFLDEGKNVLIDEFGKDYGNYFSILSLIASSKTSRAEIESIIEMQVGGYLDKLENEYALITKLRPILSKPSSRVVKYKINDNFLSFWFRFIYKYKGAIEMGNFDYVKQLILRDYPTFSGIILERYFTSKIASEENLSAIGSYWEKGNQNEIDIVALNEYEKRVIFVEVKRNREKISIPTLIEKSQSLVQQLPGYSATYRALSLNDM